MIQSAASPQSDDRELSSAEAMSAALGFFRDFDRRVANQRVIDSHAADSAKVAPGAPRSVVGETLRESEGAR